MKTILFDVLKDNEVNDTTKIELVKAFDEVLSLDLLKQEETSVDSNLVNYIESQIALRKEAKMNKNFEKADTIRNELLEKGIEIKDTREGTTWNLI